MKVAQIRLCSYCHKPVMKRTGVHHNHWLIHKKCLEILKFLDERMTKCSECGKPKPKFFEVIQGLELGFCSYECSVRFMEKGTLRKIMEGFG